jgi:hypothetical protein
MQSLDCKYAVLLIFLYGLISDPEYITDKEIHYYFTLYRKSELSINGVYYYKGGSTIFDCDKAAGKLKKIEEYI